ncbi:hypothetical protein SGFS_033000 [Streptomyces graminofaciens]|uniref:AB hydrolase-1 domain-containing protein n=1 Tax=Streptomyces graminofaciens TaxID=68212 RepID=A0ABM7F7U6_9ACTN|nr:alpha/beta fold hydrolase [Streptomyces graminofaciens]BBC32006.1 hypothetical protein SGFS_033000 [Streptomyces graminofaciens]
MTPAFGYDVCGEGPVLLIMPGGAGHPMGLGPMTEALAGRFTVVTYDPLGLAHGRLGTPVEEQRVEAWSDGAARVLERVLGDGEAAHVFGTSSGAVAALDLAARHPARLRHVVAHEPPCVAVLADGARQQARFREVYDAYRRAGIQAAGARLAAVLEEREADGREVGQALTPTEELTTPMALFLSRVLLPFTAYEPKPGPLSGGRASTGLTVAAGAESRGQLLHRTARAAADRLDGRFVEFPGGHLGTVQHPVEFAGRLVSVLGEP